MPSCLLIVFPVFLRIFQAEAYFVGSLAALNACVCVCVFSLFCRYIFVNFPLHFFFRVRFFFCLDASVATPVLDLQKYLDQGVRVKLQGGREVRGVLKGFDPLVNVVLDECIEFIRGEFVCYYCMCM